MRCCAGNVHTASGAKRFFLETARKCKQLGYVTELRFDAGFAEGATLDYLTDEKIAFLARLKANDRLQDLATPHLRRPPGRPPKEGREILVELGTYQAVSWRHAQEAGLGIIHTVFHPATDVLGFNPAQDADAVERLLAVDRRMVACLGDFIEGKRGILCLQLLKAEDVRLRLLEPGQ